MHVLLKYYFREMFLFDLSPKLVKTSYEHPTEFTRTPRLEHRLDSN